MNIPKKKRASSNLKYTYVHKERESIEKELQNRLHQQRVVSQLGLEALTGGTLSHLLDKTVHAVREVLSVEYAKVLELLPNKKRMILRAGEGWHSDIVVNKSTVDTGKNSQAGYTLSSKRPVIVEDLPNEKRFRGPVLLQDHSVRSGMSCIIAGKKEPWGVLGVHTKKRILFTQDDINFLQSVSNILASAIQRKKDEEALQQQSRLNELITTNATTGLFIMDEKQHCTFINPAAEAITGFTYEQIQKLNKPLHDIIHHKRPDGKKYPIAECPIDSAFPKRANVPGEDVFVRPDGTFYSVAFMASPILEKGKSVGTIIELRDITDEKRKEAERVRLERQKDDFLAVASHELKTPLTSLKAFNQVLELTFKRKGDYQSSELLSKMDTQINKLSALITDLLDITKIEKGKLQFKYEYFDFNEVVQEVLESVLLTTNSHKLITDMDKSRTVYADRERTGQVILNFLTNAIKYSPKESKIKIKTRIEKNSVIFSVQDFGVGISKNIIDNVFEKFYRAHGTREDTYPGLGLGLYISREIIKRQGGKIWVESVSGKGSTFYFSLPLIKKRNMKGKHVK